MSGHEEAGSKAVKRVWSVVCSLNCGYVGLAMGRDYRDVHVFRLEMQEIP